MNKDDNSLDKKSQTWCVDLKTTSSFLSEFLTQVGMKVQLHPSEKMLV